jgi:hypothetical protein
MKHTPRKITGDRDAATFERYLVLKRAAIIDAGKTLDSFQRGGGRR